jgi:photosystem II stability/assembly factor-like uncharacterized protein
MKGPEDSGDETTGKVFLRQDEFLRQRGLSREKPPLALDGQPVAAEQPESLYQLGAAQKTALLAEAPPRPAIAWRPLGPFAIPHGQTYGTDTATMSGRVSAIAVDPGDSRHILVGSAAGGIWETRDTGATWAARTDEQPTLSIGAIAFDPSDPSTVYAGTGEGNSEYLNLGQGILVSHDAGATWQIVASQVFAGFGFYRLVVDPAGGRLIAATTGGAAVSPDAGVTWGGLHAGLTWDVSLAQPNGVPEILLAAPDGLFAAHGNAAPARVDLPGLQPLDRDDERMAVAHVPSDPGQAFVFAAMQGQARLWHRPAAGRPFAAVVLPPVTGPDLVPNALDIKQASYDWHVSVPPGGDDTVYLGAIELVKGVRDGGQWQWSDISSRQSGTSIHPDQHVMAFDGQDPDVVYAGNDGGIFRSADAGASWQSLNSGLAISEVEYLAQRPDEPLWILAGLQDNGTIRRERDGTWAQVALGDGGDCGTNMDDPDVCFQSNFRMHTGRSDERGDRGSWVRVTPPDDAALRKLFYPPLEVNSDLVVKAGEVVYLSSNAGTSWREVHLPQPPANQRPSVASALAIPAPEEVLVGTIRGEVFRIHRSDSSWSQPVALTQPREGWISDLVVDPNSPERYWVTFSSPGAVFRSEDAGASWDDVTANLPAIPVNAIINDPSDSDRVWVACDVGVFESNDAGGSWAVFGTGLPNALAMDLLFYEPDRLLRVGTRSRGVWEATV